MFSIKKTYVKIRNYIAKMPKWQKIAGLLIYPAMYAVKLFSPTLLIAVLILMDLPLIIFSFMCGIGLFYDYIKARVLKQQVIQ